jgi:acyl-coenzyme A synthetase/AMP-(fatty) acid ligase
MVPHGALRNYLYWMAETYPLTGQDRVLQTVPFGFDVSLREIFWPLLSGAAVVVIRPEDYQDIARLCRFVENDRISHIRFPPSMLQLFLEEPGIEHSCRYLKRVFCGGEAMPVGLPERFFSRLNAELHNTYGPTEAAVNASAWVCERDSRRRSVPIGRPIANSVIHILDQDLSLVPTGVPGELHIGGEGIARGYLHMPDATAEKFVPDPFAIQPGRRLYKTGDLARYLPDGNIEFLGRIDNQLKIRGFRVELEEIEAAMRRHPEIRQVAVVARQNESNENRIVAYIAAAGEEAPSSHELRCFLLETLPEYMVPTSFVMLDALPLSPNGKIDRRALPLLDSAKENRTDFVAPRTQVETDLAMIWAELLNIPQVGVQSNFFDLGGHSLLVIRVASRIRAHFQTDLPLRTLFENPTVEELAEVIAEKQGGKPDDDGADQILANIASLSDEEVQRRLAGAMPGVKADIDD